MRNRLWVRIECFGVFHDVTENVSTGGIGREWRIAKAGGARLSRDRCNDGGPEGQRGQLRA